MKFRIVKIFLYLNPFISLFLASLLNYFTSFIHLGGRACEKGVNPFLPNIQIYCNELDFFPFLFWLSIIIFGIIHLILLKKWRSQFTKRQKIKFIIYFLVVIVVVESFIYLGTLI